jgi:tRNA threonylcarbamoyl adenosine modification protein YjeE
MQSINGGIETYSFLDENSLKDLATSVSKKITFPTVMCFYGDLGAGKSTFCRHFIQTFMDDFELIVPSPTFTLVQEYVKDDKTIYHFDLYRLESGEDLIELNFEELLMNGICLIEWPERAQDFLPEKRIDIYIQKEDEKYRTITIEKRIGKR